MHGQKNIKNYSSCYITLEKILCCYYRMLLQGYPSFPWGYRDQVTTLSAAKTGTRLFIRRRGYFFLRHSVLNIPGSE